MKEYTEQELHKANEEKLLKAKEYLGSKWLLHPDNAVAKKIFAEGCKK